MSVLPDVPIPPGLHVTAELMNQAASLAGDLVGGALVTCFAVGLLVRFNHWATGGDPRKRRERSAAEHQARLAARKRATDVPIHRRSGRGRRDADPALRRRGR
jgi:hypothetical protein